MSAILVTGGAGYIGSHVVLALLEAGFREIVVLDNFATSRMDVLPRLRQAYPKGISVVVGNVERRVDVERVFEGGPIASVIHLAGWKNASESVRDPLGYYGANLGGLLTLLSVMEEYECRKLVMASSAAVYGNGNGWRVAAVKEHECPAPLPPTTPYGHSKITMEQICVDLCASDKAWMSVALRYFNPIGAAPEHGLGDDPRNPTGSLMENLLRVSASPRDPLDVYWDPRAGGRDYVHVRDLARATVLALMNLHKFRGASVNVGSGVAVPVKEVVDAMQRVTGIPIEYRLHPFDRGGETRYSCADITTAKRVLCWEPTRTLDDACRDAWEFYTKWRRS